MALKNNTWKLNQWYDQDVAGNVKYDSPLAGELWTWGDNEHGALGQNTTGDTSSPKQVPGTTWSALNVSGSETNIAFAVKSDGTLWGWGTNQFGSLGQNSIQHEVSSPIQIGTDTNWSKLSDDDIYLDRTGVISARWWVHAVKTDGTLWSWGYASQGQLGLNQGGATYYSSPVQIPGTNWKCTATGRDMGVFGLKTDGTLWAWGPSGNGTLGLNQSPSTKLSSPAQIPGTTWDGIVCQGQNVMAHKSDNTLWMWGHNSYGALGQNQAPANLGGVSSPIQVPGTNWRNAGATVGDAAGAFKTDGTLWMWGRNEGGILGQGQSGDASSKSSPTQIPGTTWVNMAAIKAEGSVMAIKTDNTLWSWGVNAQGQLGHNNTTSYSSPKQIPGTSWSVRLGGGIATGYAIKTS